MKRARRITGRSWITLALVAASRVVAGQVPAQTESDAYTRYELLAPGTAKFRIVYEVTANTAGATAYFNPIRKGSVASDEHVCRPTAARRASSSTRRTGTRPATS